VTFADVPAPATAESLHPEVQRWLGHHSPAFTLSVNVHLLNDDLGGPLSAPKGVSKVSAQRTDTARNDTQPVALKAA